MEFYIYITNDCNLNCDYCSVLLNKEFSNIPLSISYPLTDLRRFVDRVQKERKDKHATICFFGGEPTLDYGKIQEIIDVFEGVRAYEISYILHTNGILLSKIPDKIIKVLGVLFLSPNYSKVLKNGCLSSYYLDIADNLQFIKQKKNVETIGRLTATSDTNLLNACTIMQNDFDYIYWQMDNREQVENIVEYKAKYKKEVALLFGHWFTSLKSGKILNYIPFLSITKNLIDNALFDKNYFCGYGFYSVFVQTDGSCYTCCEAVESSNHKIGDIYSGIKFASCDLESRPCRNCLYLKLCGGRCGRMHKDFSVTRINDFCELNQFTFNLIIKALPELKQILKENPAFHDALYDYHIDYTEQTP